MAALPSARKEAATITCATCGTENRPGRRFCVGCGNPLGLTCPSCGAATDPGDRFCGQCASPIVALAPADAQRTVRTAPPLEPTTAPIAERRLVSVLFADLVGFTALSADRDPEETRELLSRYFEVAREIVDRYGGTIEKFIGDAVMTVWGAPVAHEDDAERAVRAALDLVDAVPRLEPGLQARAAVLTGEAAVTRGAADQGMVAGDLVNTASRLQTAAASGTVLVGDATRRATLLSIAYEPAGDQSLRGKVAPVPAWRAVRVVAERGGRNRAETLEAPFVGRDEELRLLKELFHATQREGRPRLVSVIGPAGIGKTRLAWEFLKYVDGLVDTVWWHDGRSPAYGEGITFWALGEMVRTRASLLETDDERTTRAKIADTLARHVPDEEERRWIEPALLALLGVDASAARTEELFGAWRTFFERLAASAPVVLVFEDFHHADSGLVDFVDHLMEWSRGVPIYVLTLARPDLLERRPDWGAGKRSFTSVHLEPLAEPAMRALLSGLVPGLPEPAVRAIVERAGGVPLYAIETVRMLVAEGRLVPHDDVYTPAGDLRQLDVPETLHALIAARLDGLPHDERALLSDAAVIGQSFTPAGLAAVAGVSEEDLEKPLRNLVRRELLVREADARSPERGQYAFVQALIREVAYGTLAKRDRTARHLAAARFFESLGSDELAGALAGHYLAAHRTAADPEQAGALATQARIALAGAAERAVALGAHEQAVTFLGQALEVTDRPAERAEILERLGEAAGAAGHQGEAVTILTDALELRKQAGDRRAEVECAAKLGRAIVDAREGVGAIDRVRQLADGYRDLLSEEPGAVELEAQLARILNLLERDGRRALDVAERVLVAAERLDLVDVIADVLVTKGTGLASTGRPYEGLAVLEAGLRLAESRGSSRTALRARNNLAYLLIYREPARSESILVDGMAVARRIGDRPWVAQFAVNLVGALHSLGRDPEALALAADVEALALEGPGRWWLSSCRLMAQLWRGDASATEQHDLVAAAELTDPQVLGWVRWLEADAAFLDGRLGDDRALRYAVARADDARAGLNFAFAARAALLLGDREGATADLAAMDATQTRGPLIDAHRRRIMAGIAGLDGRRADALVGYREALDGFRQLKVAEEGITALDMLAILGRDDPACVAAADRARAIFEASGYRTLLRRLDAALSGAADPGIPVG